MRDDPAAELRRRYGKLLDADLNRYDGVVDVAEDLDRAALRRLLAETFAERPQVRRLLVRIGGLDVGVGTTTEAKRDPGHLGAAETTVGPGSGDGATLPGRSGQFRLVRLACPASACPDELRSYYDERFAACVHGDRTPS